MVRLREVAWLRCRRVEGRRVGKGVLKRRLLEAIWLFGCEEAKNYELARSLVGGQDGTERTLFQACAWTLSHWFNPRDGALNHNHPRIFSIRGLLEFTLPFQEARGPI